MGNAPSAGDAPAESTVEAVPEAAARPAKRAKHVPTRDEAELVTTVDDKIQMADPTKFFKFGKILGAGAFGQVHQVTSVKSTATFACKTLNTASKNWKDEMMLRELGAMMQCQHPHLIGIEQAFRHNRKLYIVMDLVPTPPGSNSSPDLFTWLTEPSGLGDELATEVQVAIIINNITLALQYLKDKMGALHRDLKPENVLVGPDGIEHLKLTDFGLARLGVDSNDGEQFQGTFNAGTEGYTAPEILDPSRIVNGQIDYGEDPHKVDVFSLGVIMFICFVKIPPFGLGPGASKDVLAGKYSMDPNQWGRVSAGGKRMVRRMLEHDQKKRYSIQQVAEDHWLEGIISSIPVPEDSGTAAKK